MVKKGKIVDAGGHKKWIDQWHCSMHGPADLPEEKDDLK